MSKTEVIVILSAALAVIAWAVVTEMRIRRLQYLLVLSEEKSKDAEITLKIHSEPDSDLDRELANDLGGSKPQA